MMEALWLQGAWLPAAAAAVVVVVAMPSLWSAHASAPAEGARASGSQRGSTPPHWGGGRRGRGDKRGQHSTRKPSLPHMLPCAPPSPSPPEPGSGQHRGHDCAEGGGEACREALLRLPTQVYQAQGSLLDDLG